MRKITNRLVAVMLTIITVFAALAGCQPDNAENNPGSSEDPQKTVLTLATLFELPRHFQNAIAEFNSSNQQYSIEVINYFGEDGWSFTNGLLRLNTEITAGTIPDILYTSTIPYEDYVRSGLLVDLYPFIESDPDLSSADFIAEVLHAAEIDGKLYRAFPDFMISTVVGNSSIVGADMGWTIEEFLSVLDTHPEADLPLGSHYEKEAFLVSLVMSNISEFIDWDTGTARFDTPGFIQLLEIANRISKGTQEERIVGDTTIVIVPDPAEDISSGRQILWSTTLLDFYSIQRNREMFGGDIAFKGWPNKNRNGNNIAIGQGFAITEQSANKEAAWMFLRTFFDTDWQINNIRDSFPINQDAFEQKANDALESDIYTQYETEIISADIDTIISLIDSASPMLEDFYDSAISDILLDGASGYFNGVRSAQDAARDIQSRISIYLSERS